MWIVAGVLLGVVVLGVLVGFHTGPHTHVVAGVVGLIAAVWLLVMALVGGSTTVLWVVFGADLVVSGGIGVMAVVGLSSRRRATGAGAPARRLEAAEGTALSDLTPEGVVRVNGEQWSAVSLNGTVRARSRIQVIRVAGLRLEVWGEEAEPAPGGSELGGRPTSEGKGT